MQHLGLFAKFWQPGRVKTRLGAELGDDLACRVYQFFLSHLICRLKNAGQQRTIVFSPPDQAAAFAKASGSSWATVAQADGDLGQRMSAFFEFSFAEKKSEQFSPSTSVHAAAGDGSSDFERKTIIIGSDCPLLSDAEIDAAFRQLDDQPVVLGPSDDGGYYLIGMRNECFHVAFEGIDWSTERVLDQTIERLKSHGIGYSTLGMKTDIDEFPNLLDLLKELQRTCQPGDPDFVLCGAIEGVLAASRQRESQS